MMLSSNPYFDSVNKLEDYAQNTPSHTTLEKLQHPLDPYLLLFWREERRLMIVKV